MRRFTFCFGVFLALAFAIGIVGAFQQGDFSHVVKNGVTSLVPSYPIEQATIKSPSIDRATITSTDLTAAGGANKIGLVDFQLPTGTLTGNATDQTIYTKTFPANLLGPGQGLKISVCDQKVSGTNSNTFRVFVGATQVGQSSLSPAVNLSCMCFEVINNPGVQNAQTVYGWPIFSGAGSVLLGSQIGTAAIDTTQALTVKSTFNVASPDTVQGQFWKVELIQ